MSNHNWPKIRETLAEKVMEFQRHEMDCGCVYWDDTPGYNIYGLSLHDPDCLELMHTYLWRPDVDLNQAFQILRENHDAWTIDQNKSGWVMCQLDYGTEEHPDPAKAICLAVLKSTGEDLSDYEEKEEIDATR